MKLTHLGHSSVLIEIERPSQEPARILLDPGNLATPSSYPDPVDAILVTHPHGDHLDEAQIGRVRSEGSVPLYAHRSAAGPDSELTLHDVVNIEPGTIEVAGIEVVVGESAHEAIYPGLPLPPNLTFLIAQTVFAPGDSFAIPTGPVDVLLLPIGAPWMKLSETVDYLRAVAPRIAIPVHDAGLAEAHRALHRGLITRLAPEGTTVQVLQPGQAWTLPA